jgi:predicted DNA-binding ribbon-helix-helix protein
MRANLDKMQFAFMGKTSVSLQAAFWARLKESAGERYLSHLVAALDSEWLGQSAMRDSLPTMQVYLRFMRRDL